MAIPGGRPGGVMVGLAGTNRDDVTFVARVQVKKAALTVLRAQHGYTAVVRRPIGGPHGRGLHHDVPADPVEGVAAAQLVSDLARNLTLTYVREARGQGRDWTELAAALGAAPGDGAAAFACVAESYPVAGGPYRFWWQCDTCRRHVVDYGPGSRADGNESGHTPSCARA